MSVVRCLTALAVAVVCCPLSAAQIEGEYLEARTCDVYTGPCFANAEMNLGGKEALLAWKVDRGSWDGVALDGLGAALVLSAENTIGDTGVFRLNSGKISAVIIVDENADVSQREALISFVKDTAKRYTANVVAVESAPIELNNDHLASKGEFKAGKLASIATREMRGGDCVCTNEEVYYQPLVKVENFVPAYSLSQSYQGDKLNNRWTSRNTRSSFLGTFRY